ncbi:MAG TPA: ribonuclease R [Candidatus Binatia bacterium]|nr:ribonuclease R [Candidatus Binatia bacterium]
MRTTDDDDLDARLLATMARRPGAVSANDLLRAARVARDERDRAMDRLDALESAGRIVRSHGNRLVLAKKAGVVAGRLEVHSTGYGFVRPDDEGADDVYVPSRGTHPAMHGDRVLVELERGRQRGRLQGRVTRILERAVNEVVGVYHAGRTTGVVVPQETRITMPMLVPHDARGEAVDGDMVVARIVRWPGPEPDAEVAITRVLGPAGDPRVETDAVIHTYGLPLVFPPEVIDAATNVARRVTDAECAGRLDLRTEPIVTIDGETARDFDDAVLVETEGDGYRLTVAVADVAHYVPAGGPIDQEARARGTSVYFPDRVIPMLPEALSNEICSLRPHEDRLAMVVRLSFDTRGRTTGATFHRGVIRSAARLTYTQVRQVLVDRDPAVREQLGALVAPLELAETLARLLMARRRSRGAIDFDLPEAEILLDVTGRPENIIRAERSIAHQLIEEFMLAANEAVARELGRRGLPAIHRVHAPPSASALRDLARFLEGFGLRLELTEGRTSPRAFQKVLDRAGDRPEARLVNMILLRSMQQARYAAEPQGHFGLATDDYLHFTSPIRRYPDLIVHRLLDVALGGSGRAPDDLTAIADESSRRERTAMDAEREVVQLKKIQYMADKVGQEYDGFVSGVTAFGIFVELSDVFVDGLIHISTLGDDFYEHREAQHLLRGRKTRRTFRVGDPIRVTVAGVSIERRQIDFVLAGEKTSTKWAKPIRKKPGRKKRS